VTPAELLASELRRDGARPLLTWYDDGTGERIELSVATAANWAAKTANLLVDEHGLGPGDMVALRPYSHWLSVVVALGAWTAGVTINVRDDADAELMLPGEPTAFMRTVLPQPDALLVAPARATDTALLTGATSSSLQELVDAAGAPPSRCRVLTTLPLMTVDGFVAAVVGPLVAGGSSVLVTNPDASRLPARAETERVTHTAGVHLAAVPALISG
jgi:acyl-CoA synthetase (AMP-forming)/AMP-acid ligase II